MECSAPGALGSRLALELSSVFTAAQRFNGGEVDVETEGGQRLSGEGVEKELLENWAVSSGVETTRVA